MAGDTNYLQMAPGNDKLRARRIERLMPAGREGLVSFRGQTPRRMVTITEDAPPTSMRRAGVIQR